MKTKYFSIKNPFLKSIVGLLGLMVVSCGSYQNKSYYDNDGIYGAEKQKSEENASNNKVSEANQKYKEYFASNANNYSNEQPETFTDVENYSSENDSIVNQKTEGYASWGDNSDNVTINVYNNDWAWGHYGYWNNYWGYRPWGPSIYVGWTSWNYGWGSPYWGYYGPSWGYYSPYYYGYYGYNNYYGCNNYYGYNGYNGYYYGNNYAYNHGRRGSAYNNRYSDNNGSYRSNATSPTRNYAPNRNYTPGRRSTSITPRNEGYNPRTIQTPPRKGTRNNEANPNPRSEYNNNNNSTPRPRTSTPRNDNPNPRNYNSDSPRSSTPQSSGSGYSGGGSRTGGRRG